MKTCERCGKTLQDFEVRYWGKYLLCKECAIEEYEKQIQNKENPYMPVSKFSITDWYWRLD